MVDAGDPKNGAGNSIEYATEFQTHRPSGVVVTLDAITQQVPGSNRREGQLFLRTPRFFICYGSRRKDTAPKSILSACPHNSRNVDERTES